MKTDEFLLEQLIIHRVPDKKPGSPVGPSLSDATGDHAPAVRAYFQRRLRDVLATRGQDIKVSDNGDKSATDSVADILSDPGKFVPRSQHLAELLYQVQDGRNSAGILVVGLGRLDNQPAVGLLKLENERGVRAEERRTSGGARYFEVVIHDDLLLTDHTQVFKAAVFRYRSGTSGALSGKAADQQVQRNLASFFLQRFLGCELTKHPSVQTERFFDTTEAFLRVIESPEERARCEIALLNHMQSRLVRTIDPVRFADEVLNPETHQRFLDHLKEHDIPETVFPKDTSSIEPRIKRVAYDFESGIKLMGRPDAMETHVTFGQRQGRRSRVIIQDEMVNVGSRG